MRRCNIFIGVVLAVLLPASAAHSLEQGQMAPDFTLIDIVSGEPFSLSDYRGQVVVLNFWAYWCEFCEFAAPAFTDQIFKVYEPQGVAFVGIEKGERRPSWTGNIKNPRHWVETFGWTFKNGIDTDRSVFPAFNAFMDQYMVLDVHGRAIYVSTPVGWEDGWIDIPPLIAAIKEGLLAAPVPVQPVTWSRLKRLWAP
jgi:peroxiredoxin